MSGATPLYKPGMMEIDAGTSYARLVSKDAYESLSFRVDVLVEATHDDVFSHVDIIRQWYSLMLLPEE